MQTEHTIEGQIKELHSLLQQDASFPMVLLGHSWGAMLSCMFAARYPALVRSLVLIASPPLEDCYVPEIMETRLNRLDINGRKQLYRLIEALNRSEGKEKDIALSELGAFMGKADSFDPLPGYEAEEQPSCQAAIFHAIQGEFNEMRKSGALLDIARHIQCSIVAIHGDYDPHPAEGVEKPLTHLTKNFRFIQVSNCGHRPWLERQAKDIFFEILGESITTAEAK